VVVEDWRCDDNANRPHSVHGELTQPNSPYSGPRPTNPKPHSDWTTKRVPSGDGETGRASPIEGRRPDTAGAVRDVHRVFEERQSPGVHDVRRRRREVRSVINELVQGRCVIAWGVNGYECARCRVDA
jgi:hypothetical protein